MKETKFVDAGADLKNRHFTGEVIIGCMRWYLKWCLKYPISYRNLEEMMQEREVEVDYTTIYRGFKNMHQNFIKELNGMANVIAIVGELTRPMSR